MASIRDIAKMAGVSPASVSRILNNDPSFSINKNTRARVIEIANRVQYSKKNSERGPKSAGRKMTIGLILRHDAKTELSFMKYMRELKKKQLNGVCMLR